jgi:uncharacterized membrane protein
LDIRFPEAPYSDFYSNLISVLPRILAYILSFIIIGLYWVSHHNSMIAIRKTDRGFLWLNILFLLCVSFIPFPTSLVGRYPFQPGPIIVYGITLIVCNAVAYVMVLYVHYHPHLAVPEFKEKYLSSHTPVYIIINGAYLLAILSARTYPLLSYFIYIGAVATIIILFTKLDDGININ